jgi:hypothetical protein
LPAATVTQLPSLPATLQALQLAPQARLQQNPSTQLALRHSALFTHESPLGFWPMHWLPTHRLPVAQSAEVLQLAGQPVSTPLQVYGAQLGDPALPAGELTQLPVMPATLQESQLSVHGALQHTPSAQWPLWQSAPKLHAPPRGCWATQLPTLQ